MNMCERASSECVKNTYTHTHTHTYIHTNDTRLYKQEEEYVSSRHPDLFIHTYMYTCIHTYIHDRALTKRLRRRTRAGVII
jgi:hypothetical protein